MTIFTDNQRPEFVRALAIQPLWNWAADWEPPVALTALTALLEHEDLHLATAAAYALIDRAGFDLPVRRAVARWPEKAPYPAGPVRRILAARDALGEGSSA